jgi:hypothetical protein
MIDIMLSLEIIGVGGDPVPIQSCSNILASHGSSLPVAHHFGPAHHPAGNFGLFVASAVRPRIPSGSFGPSPSCMRAMPAPVAKSPAMTAAGSPAGKCRRQEQRNYHHDHDGREDSPEHERRDDSTRAEPQARTEYCPTNRQRAIAECLSRETLQTIRPESDA